MVELHADQQQVVANQLEHQLEAAVDQLLRRRGGVEPARARFLGDLRGQIDHVGADVAALGQRRLDTVRLLIAGQQRLAEQADLRSGVVDVVLARD